MERAFGVAALEFALEPQAGVAALEPHVGVAGAAAGVAALEPHAGVAALVGVGIFDAVELALECVTGATGGGVGALDGGTVAYESSDGGRGTGGSIGPRGGGVTIGVCRLDIVGGVGCFDMGGGAYCSCAAGGMDSCRDGACEYALYGGFSASGDDTLGAFPPHTELSCSARRVLPLRPDSADRPDRLTERSAGRIGSGIGGPERGVWIPLAEMSRDLPFEWPDDVDVVRVRSTSKPRELTAGGSCTGRRGDACAEGRPLRILGSRDGGCETEREGPRSDGEESTVTLSSGELSGSSSSARRRPLSGWRAGARSGGACWSGHA